MYINRVITFSSLIFLCLTSLRLRAYDRALLVSDVNLLLRCAAILPRHLCKFGKVNCKYSPFKCLHLEKLT